MKIRLLDDSIRIRISRGELDTLASKGAIKSHTSFPSGELRYQIVVEEDSSISLSASETGATIRMGISSEKIDMMVGTDSVGFDFYAENSSGGQIKCLFEKDYTCGAPRGEDESDLFPNPNENSKFC